MICENCKGINTRFNIKSVGTLLVISYYSYYIHFNNSELSSLNFDLETHIQQFLENIAWFLLQIKK